MADNKKSFILYCDQKGVWDKLNDEQAGKLIKHIIAYVNDENPKADDFITELAFEPIKQHLKRDLKKWEKQYEQRVEAGKKSAEARKRNSTAVNERSISSTDNVNVNGSVSDTVNEIFIYLDGEKIFDPINILEYYEVQLNGTQKENKNVSWRAKIPDWMVDHAGEEFNSGEHLKNSFKRFYLNTLKNDWKSVKKSNGANSPKFSGDYSEAL